MEKVRKFLAAVSFIAGILGGLYVGGWLMFIQPIMTACKAYDTGTLTGTIIGLTVLKCIFASVGFVIVFYIGCILCLALLGIGKRRKKRM